MLLLLLPAASAAWAEAYNAHRVAHASIYRAMAHASGRAAIAMDSSWHALMLLMSCALPCEVSVPCLSKTICGCMNWDGCMAARIGA